jgi:anti-sigma regulatory factor (Ser/Thr protein kinase)
MESVASSVSAARRYVREVLREVGAADLEESAELGVSELVTNAVLHARSAFTVAVREVGGGRIRIEVSDTSPLPLQPRPSALSATTGRGLQLVADLSVDWGVEEPVTGGPGKTVWFEPRGADVEESAAQDWSLDLDALL